MEYPPIQGWLHRHPRLARQLRQRLSPKSFTGLPLTLLGGTFFYVLALLLGIVEDYLSHDPLIAADVRIANLLFVVRSAEWLQIFYVLTLLAESAVVIVAAIVLSVVLWLRKQRVFVFALWLTLIFAEGVTYFGKLLFHRGRPDMLLRALSEDSFSFPSGHATTAAAFYGFLAYLIIRHCRSWKIRIATIATTALLIIAVDISRLYLGVHYLSDVLAGNLVGIAALLFAVAVTEWLIAERRVAASGAFRWSWIAVAAASILIAVWVVLKIAPLPSVQRVAIPERRIGSEDALPLFQNGTLSRYTETLIGTTQEPVNIIILAPKDCFTTEMARSEWVLADGLSPATIERISKTALLNQEYPTAPMTPSFYEARPHDYGFEKETDRKTVRSRHHARFWNTGYATPAGNLFAGTVSLDTGLKWGITHAIAPDIDTERDLLVSDLTQAGVVAHEERVPWIPPTLGKNFSGDQFFTDGKAILLTFQSCGSP